jgi:hypothetical protein
LFQFLLAVFWWNPADEQAWYFELPSPIPGKRRLLFLNIDMIPHAEPQKPN